ncbi:hypothetical protein GCM10027275_17790 [Rhabdobacter roseus]
MNNTHKLLFPDPKADAFAAKKNKDNEEKENLQSVSFGGGLKGNTSTFIRST